MVFISAKFAKFCKNWLSIKVITDANISTMHMFTSLQISETVKEPEENSAGSFESVFLFFLSPVCCKKSIRFSNKSATVLNVTSELLIP